MKIIINYEEGIGYLWQNFFSKSNLKNLEFKNRIVMAPMCMYTVEDDGVAKEWHEIHRRKPYWALEADHELDNEMVWPEQYARGKF